jgi:hypothetical protein
MICRGISGPWNFWPMAAATSLGRFWSVEPQWPRAAYPRAQGEVDELRRFRHNAPIN